MENSPIVLDDKCKTRVSGLNPQSKYIEFKDCKNIVKIDKKNFEEISSKNVSQKCADYIKKQLRENKNISRKDLFENCDAFKKVAEKKKGKGRISEALYRLSNEDDWDYKFEVSGPSNKPQVIYFKEIN